jgi:hypothetical protein
MLVTDLSSFCDSTVFVFYGSRFDIKRRKTYSDAFFVSYLITRDRILMQMQIFSCNQKVRPFGYTYESLHFFNFVFKFSIIVVCIQFFFSVIRICGIFVSQHCVIQIASWVWMQCPGRDSPRRDFPDPSTRNLPRPHIIKVDAKGLVGSGHM